ncbi:NfeD family protein [Tannockella kyphosi]|uniref:NfeD family protein n=1 Tax=Tannockella kyphosi TaxID=2899121 RepID=UPI00201171CF|nr:NfeD family protein [Tannockella kyphosi]
MITLWLLIIIISIIIEAITTDLVSIWFGLGAIIAMLGSLFGFNDSIQIALFIIATATSLIVTRPIAKKYFKTNVVPTNSDRLIGKHAVVIKEINQDSKGEVKVLSSFWAASSFDNSHIACGSYCEVLAIEGAHLIVKQIES